MRIKNFKDFAINFKIISRKDTRSFHIGLIRFLLLHVIFSESSSKNVGIIPQFIDTIALRNKPGIETASTTSYVGEGTKTLLHRFL